MGKFKSFDFGCEACGHVAEAVILDLNCEDPEHYICGCGAVMAKLMAAPMVLQASFPDGTKRPDIQAAKLANKLHIESLNHPPEQRGEYKKEIAKVNAKT